MTTLSSRVGRSVAWSTVGSAAMKIGQLLIGIIAARLLVPEQFGVFAVTLVVYGVVVNISELGVGSALIRTRGNLDKLAPTAVTVSLVSAASLAAVMAGLAPFLAEGFGVAQARGPIMVMALVVLLAGPSAVPAALLTKRFRQDKRLLADGTNFIFANTVLVLLALDGHGAYALAWSRVAGQVVSVVVLLLVAERRDQPGFQRAAFCYFLSTGLPLVGANLIGFGIGAVDVAIVGHAVGAEGLGAYNLAGNVAGWPLALMMPVLVNVGLPLVTMFRTDSRELSNVVGALIAAVGLVFLPVTGLLAVLSHSVVLSLYGPVWMAAAPVLAVLAVSGGVRVLLAVLFDVLVAANATGMLLAIQVVWLVAFVGAAEAGVRLAGPVGAAVGVTCTVGLIVLPITLLTCHRRIGLAVASIARPSLWPASCAIVSTAVAGLSGNLISDASPFLTLVTAGAAGILAYVFLVFRRGRGIVSRLRSLLDHRGSTHGSDVEAHRTLASAVEVS